MNLSWLSYVIEIERCGSINRAAQNLYVSQSNLSSTIKLLENEIGYALFHRTNQGIRPTSEGYLFIQSAKAILAEVSKIYEIPSFVEQAEDLSLSCTWSSAFLHYFIQFKQDNKSEAYDSYKETSLTQNFEDVQENRYRMALMYCLHSQTQHFVDFASRTNLSAQVLVRNIPIVVLASMDHPLAKKSEVVLKDLEGCKLAIFEDCNLEDIFERRKGKITKHMIPLFDRGGMRDIICQGNYISVVKKGTLSNLVANNLVEIPIVDVNDSFDVILLKHTYYEPNGREKAYIEYFLSHF